MSPNWSLQDKSLGLRNVNCRDVTGLECCCQPEREFVWQILNLPLGFSSVLVKFYFHGSWILAVSCLMKWERSTVNWINTSDTQRGCAFTRISLRLECTFPAGLGWVKSAMEDGPIAFPLSTDWSCCLPQERSRKTDLDFFGCFTFQKEQLSANTRK